MVQAGSIGNLFVGGTGDGSLDLAIPALDTPESLLSFANTAVDCVGRTAELAELKRFITAEWSFSWWVWTGPAGIGKSRLAVELCRYASTREWHAGFLRETDQDEFGHFQAQRPTLLVIDYAAQRSRWLSDALVLLSRQHQVFPVRVLILERDTSGEWWSVTRRVNRLEESCGVTAAMYAEPRPMSGLDRPNARALVKNMIARLAAAPLTTGQVEQVVDRAEAMDPALRPLFVQVSTIDRLSPGEERPNRDYSLRRIVARSTAWLESQVATPQSAMLAHNLRFLATTLGGMTITDYESLHPLPDTLTDLLPGVFQRLGSSVAVDDLVDGVRPDIIGELFVLDRFGAEPTVALASARMVGYAARKWPDSYRGFVERLVADHADHERLLDLLEASGDGESALSDAELAVSVIQLLGRSDHPVIRWIFDRLDAAIEEGLVEGRCRLITTARFKVANLVRLEDDALRARDLYSEALADCDPEWPEYYSLLNNRGITLCTLQCEDLATTDFSTIIGSPSAPAEVRACALNNRADILDTRGDLDGAIADRSSVLELPGTSYDRRYIALFRRALARRKQGISNEAHDDVNRILGTADIAVEQKMQALLLRAQWAFDDGNPARAQADLDEIAASYRNFESVEKKAQELRDTFTKDSSTK
ncbi:hypothetical protein B0293_42015 [Amycolatopsis azurea DSM 43854]|uniref:ATP-binding protein n=1 Tax=Amycolatopsis azurea DSM 43854 TaxID=1238180 RepID=A0ABX3IYW3_9PSEU|nr:hypothetical protein B0293_42015 [Amycolatopsis azurea DSM 43854]